ncbi:MAG: hypothetical protein N0C88_01420 [Candidatus Thiodiazotropha lotti]|uniref:Uncharacterized protein n=1 Tax=Candidatus Thiodiazotropha lotti TaxID=2792787 RepID=A0A9E4MZ99_9GAMM|nr:hypothetical protein [Candidatus Thiodiazotropha lotti]MCW4201971.1 hypothetical protein [Candidatus Thiodiazotropha lotti]
MRNRIIFGIAAFLFSLSAHGDLSNKQYIEAKKLYYAKNWQAAKSALESYVSMDGAFLKKNPNILSSINLAIDHCKTKLKPPVLVLTGAISEIILSPPPPPPSLP